MKALCLIIVVVGLLAVPLTVFAEWNWRGELARTEGFLGGKSSWSVEPESAETRKGDEQARQRIYRESQPEGRPVQELQRHQPKASMMPSAKKKYTGSIEF